MSEPNRKRKKRSTKKRWSTKKKVIVSTVIVFALLICTLATGYMYIRSKIYSGLSPSETISDTEYKEVEGITNVLLIGTDARTLDEASRAIEEAENHMEYVQEVEVPTIKKEISRLLEPLREDVYGYWCDFSGTHLLERLKRKLEE